MDTVRFVSKEHILIWNWESGTGNREPGTGSLFLIWVNVSDISKLLIGNRESGTGFWFLILVCNSNISKVQIGNKEPVPGSFLTIILFMLVSGIVYFINM